MRSNRARVNRNMDSKGSARQSADDGAGIDIGGSRSTSDGSGRQRQMGPDPARAHAHTARARGSQASASSPSCSPSSSSSSRSVGGSASSSVNFTQAELAQINQELNAPVVSPGYLPELRGFRRSVSYGHGSVRPGREHGHVRVCAEWHDELARKKEIIAELAQVRADIKRLETRSRQQRQEMAASQNKHQKGGSILAEIAEAECRLQHEREQALAELQKFKDLACILLTTQNKSATMLTRRQEMERKGSSLRQEVEGEWNQSKRWLDALLPDMWRLNLLCACLRTLVSSVLHLHELFDLSVSLFCHCLFADVANVSIHPTFILSTASSHCGDAVGGCWHARRNGKDAIRQLSESKENR